MARNIPCERGANTSPGTRVVVVVACLELTDHPELFALVHFAARFIETGMVPSADLGPDRRVATLTEKGLLVLQQRYIHYLTRAEMQLTSLQAVCQHVLIEAELHEDWCTDLTALRVDRGEPLGEALSAEAAEIPGLHHGSRTTLQSMLDDPLQQAEVRRRVRQEIARRRDA